MLYTHQCMCELRQFKKNTSEGRIVLVRQVKKVKHNKRKTRKLKIKHKKK